MALKDPKREEEHVDVPGSHWDDPKYARRWAEEADRRYQEIVEGKLKTLSAVEVVRRARAALRNADVAPDHARLWKEEIDRRYQEYKQGNAQVFDVDDVIAELRAEPA